MNKIPYLFAALLIFSISLFSCSGSDKTKETPKEKEETEMTVDEEELEKEFEKLDEEVEMMDTSVKSSSTTKKTTIEEKIVDGKKIVEKKVEIKTN